MSSLLERVIVYLAIAIGITTFLKLPKRIPLISRLLISLIVTFLLIALVLFISAVIAVIVIVVLVVAVLSFLSRRK